MVHFNNTIVALTNEVHPGDRIFGMLYKELRFQDLYMGHMDYNPLTSYPIFISNIS
mgnify:CR=1 FL=1